MERILTYAAIIVLAVGFHVWTVSDLKAGRAEEVAESARVARKAALEECANANKTATYLMQREAAVTQIVLSAVARSQLAAAEQAKNEAQRLADAFGRQLVAQREAMPLPAPCNITRERAELLNRAVGATP